MSLYDSMQISSSAMSAHRLRLEIISSNLANIHTTRTPDGGPYQRKDVVFNSSNISFGDILNKEIETQSPGVSVERLFNDNRPFTMKYEPNHPDAGPNGYVAYPNVNVVEEMVNMIAATRSFEANISVFEAAKNMALRAIELGA